MHMLVGVFVGLAGRRADLQRLLTALPAVLGSHLAFAIISVPSGDAG